MCRVDRSERYGFCGCGDRLKIARAALHFWEEPCISGRGGSGAVFFSGCNLRCCFCQNYNISSEGFGKEITVERLSDIFLELQEKGAENINLVTPTHYVPFIIKALDMVKHKLDIPVVFNCGGYELKGTIDMLEGYIDVYLPDMKYFSSDISSKYSNAPDYFEYASEAILAMIKQVGKLTFNSEGGLMKGTVIRHMVLPSHRHDSIKLIEWIADNTSRYDVLVSIMNQYTPFDFISEEFSELKRKVTKMEYNSVINRAAELGLKGFTQERSSASEDYVPDFDLSGI